MSTTASDSRFGNGRTDGSSIVPGYITTQNWQLLSSMPKLSTGHKDDILLFNGDSLEWINRFTTDGSIIRMGSADLAQNLTLPDSMNNLVLGQNSMDACITPSQNNVCIGYDQCHYGHQYSNVCIGTGNLHGCTLGGDMNLNVAIGSFCLAGQACASARTCNTNVAIGYRALFSALSACNNVALGQDALKAATTGGNNVSIGTEAGLRLTTGHDNVLLGQDAGSNITSAIHSLFIGNNANCSNAGGDITCAIGLGENSLVSANYGISIGVNSSTTAANSVAIGSGADSAGTATCNGASSVAVGAGSVAASDYAIALGAGAKAQAINSVIIGRDAYNNPDCSECVCIGHDAYSAVSNAIVLQGGTTRITNWTGNLRISTMGSAPSTNATMKWDSATGYVYADTSSRRYKDAIEDLDVDGVLVPFMKMRPRMYGVKGDTSGKRLSGLIAEELYDIPEFKEFVACDADGNPNSVSYDHLVVPCIAAIQKLFKLMLR